MATPANTFTTIDAVGNREDLSNMIYDISPTENPFVTSIAKTSATAIKHEWQTDELAQAVSTNAKIEGDDASTQALTPTVRVDNICQISDKVARVSGTQRSVDSAGRGDELTYQIYKKNLELRNDMEKTLLANKAKNAGNAVTARQLAGVESYLGTNVNLGATGTAPTGNGSDVRVAGTTRAFSKALLDDVLEKIWTEGGRPDTIMVNGKIKQAVSSMVNAGTDGAAQRVTTGNATTINTNIDVYVSDFGELKIVPNRFQVADSLLVLQTDMFCLATLRSFEETALAKTGDSDAVQIITEYTLESKNEKASGIVADLDIS